MQFIMITQNVPLMIIALLMSYRSGEYLIMFSHSKYVCVCLLMFVCMHLCIRVCTIVFSCLCMYVHAYMRYKINMKVSYVYWYRYQAKIYTGIPDKLKKILVCCLIPIYALTHVH